MNGLWISVRAWDGLGAAFQLPNLATAALECGVTTRSAFQKHGFNLIDITPTSAARDPVSLPMLASSLSKHLHTAGEPPNADYIIPYDYSTAVALNGLVSATIITPPPSLCHQLDNKLESKILFSEMGIPCVDYVIGPSAIPTEWQSQTMIARLPVSSGGRGAQIFNAPTELSNRFEQALIEPFVAGKTINTNAVVYEDRILIYPLCLQQNGTAPLGSYQTHFAGNDFCAAKSLDDSIHQKVHQSVQTVGMALQRQGFLGVFGLDFLLADDGRLFALEINPRFQNSTGLLNYIAASNSFKGPMAAHFEALTGATIQLLEPDREARVEAAQIYVRATKPTQRALVLNAASNAGLHAATSFAQSELSLVDFPEEGIETICEGALIGRLLSTGSSLYFDNNKLKPEKVVEHFLRAVHQSAVP